MKIGIDAISAIGRSGNSTYARELLTHLEQADKKNFYYLFSFLHDWGRKTPLSYPGRKNWKEVHPYVSRSLLPFDRLDVLNDSLVRLAARLRGIELFHFTNPLNFIAGSYKSIVTLHDLAPFHDIAWSKANMQGVFAQKIREIVKKADAIIAVSEFTKKDLIETLNVPASKIRVIHEAASEYYYPDPDLIAIEQKFNTKKYVLYAGQLQPRKNALNLLKAWSAITTRLPEYTLILVGSARDEEYRTAMQEVIYDRRIANSVIFAGSVDDDTLRKLYSGARCFVYPSFFEGFGLPVLEALQCGTPVIASNTSSLPEVVGEAGLLVDPHNPEDIANAIERLLRNDVLMEEMQKKALLQSQKFSWAKAAEETLAVYNQLL